MSSKDRTTSVKLDADTRSRLHAMARVRHRSAHALMKEAIAFYLIREEMALWKDYLDQHGRVPNGTVHVGEWLRFAEPVGLPEHVRKQIVAGNNRVRVLRGWRGMTIEKLAADAYELGAEGGLGYLKAIEDGAFRPSPGMAVILARALAVTPEDVLG